MLDALCGVTSTACGTLQGPQEVSTEHPSQMLLEASPPPSSEAVRCCWSWPLWQVTSTHISLVKTESFYGRNLFCLCLNCGFPTFFDHRTFFSLSLFPTTHFKNGPRIYHLFSANSATGHRNNGTHKSAKQVSRVPPYHRATLACLFSHGFM